MSIEGKFAVVIASTDWPMDKRHVTLGGKCDYVEVPDENLLRGVRRIAVYNTADDAFSAIANWRTGGTTVYAVARATDLIRSVSTTITLTSYEMKQ